METLIATGIVLGGLALLLKLANTDTDNSNNCNYNTSNMYNKNKSDAFSGFHVVGRKQKVYNHFAAGAYVSILKGLNKGIVPKKTRQAQRRHYYRSRRKR